MRALYCALRFPASTSPHSIMPLSVGGTIDESENICSFYVPFLIAYDITDIVWLTSCLTLNVKHHEFFFLILHY